MSSVEFRCLTISAGDGRRVLDQETGQHRRAYDVKLQSDATNTYRRFKFYDSIANEERGKKGLGSEELLWAFHCFLSDAVAGQDGFAGFCDDYGYDQDSRRAHAMWQGCRDAAEKVRGLFHGEPDLYGMLQELDRMGVG